MTPHEQADEAVRLARAALTRNTASRAGKAKALIGLGGALTVRFQHTTRGRADLDEAVDVLRQAVPLTPAAHKDRAEAETALSTALTLRQLPEDLDEALLLLRRRYDAVRGGSAEGARLDLLCGTTLIGRFMHRQQTADLDEAIQRLERVATLGHSSVLTVPARVHLALALVMRLREQVRPDDAERRRIEELVAGIEAPDGNPYVADGVAQVRQLLATLPAAATAGEWDGAPLTARTGAGGIFDMAAETSRSLDHLRAYGKDGDLERQDAIIAAARADFDDPTRWEPHPPSAMLVLGFAYHGRYRNRMYARVTGAESDLREAEQLARRVLDLPDAAAYRPQALLLLGSCLMDQGIAGMGGPETPDDAVAYLRRAVTAALSPAARLGITVRLTEALIWRAGRTGDLDDLSAAADLLVECRERLSVDASVRPVVQARLAVVHMHIGLATQATHDVLLASLTARTALAELADVSVIWSYDLARGWGDWCWALGRWSDAAEGYQQALLHLRRLVSSQSGRAYAEQAAGRQTEFLACRAAAALVRIGRPADAVVALDSGRALLMATNLDRDGADLDALVASGRSDLASRYRDAVDRVVELENATIADLMTVGTS